MNYRFLKSMMKSRCRLKLAMKNIGKFLNKVVQLTRTLLSYGVFQPLVTSSLMDRSWRW